MTDYSEGISTPVVIGCDHAAFSLKETIKTWLLANGFEVSDVGTHGLASVNYTDFGKKVAQAVSSGKNERGILLCGTGLGMSMLANKYKNVRAALCSEEFSTRMSRLHNDANILVMGARVIGESLAISLVEEWFKTPFEGGRHLSRIEAFDKTGMTV